MRRPWLIITWTALISMLSTSTWADGIQPQSAGSDGGTQSAVCRTGWEGSRIRCSITGAGVDFDTGYFTGMRADTVYAVVGVMNIRWEAQVSRCVDTPSSFSFRQNAILTVNFDVPVTGFNQGLASYAAWSGIKCSHWGGDGQESSEYVVDPIGEDVSLAGHMQGSGCYADTKSDATLKLSLCAAGSDG